MKWTRRGFLSCLAAGLAGAEAIPTLASAKDPFFLTRGLIVTVPELEAMDCPAIAHQAGINTLDLAHHGDWAANTELGRKTLADCQRLGIAVEYSAHVASAFLPRSWYDKDPALFRMDEQGRRVREHNLCVSSPQALEIVAEHAARYARTVRPTTGRYFLWIDDGQPMCRCPKCRGLSDSDQALLFENRVLRALRTVDSTATLCHLAYQITIAPPRQVNPDPGIFLQFAPIERDTRKPLSDAAAALLPGWRTHGQILELLDANLAVFGRESAQVLDYWLDNARASQWDRAKLGKLPWNKDAFLDDLATLGRRGIRHVRTYAVWFDRDYLHRFGMPPFEEYGRGLLAWRPGS